MTAPVLRVIGRIESPFRQKFTTPRQPGLAPTALSRLRLDPALAPRDALRGLSEFSHVWLLWQFHLNTNKAYRPVVHPPRLKGRTVGVFATRSPHRPSPIGLTLARLERVEDDCLVLSGLDLIDGTPIVDLKPYIPEYDHAPGARVGWVGRVEPERLEVRFSPLALRGLAAAADPAALEKLIVEVLSSDPRNPRDRAQRREGKELGFLLGDVDVCFRIDGRTAVVLLVEPGSKRKPTR